MTEVIRRIEESDFKEVSLLYNGRKSIEELKWLFSDPNKTEIFNAFVAENKSKEIIGVCGYVLSNYSNGLQNHSGVIPMSWKLASSYKGMAGVMLFKKVISLGDFGITISGSEKAQELYRLFKFNQISAIGQYYKVVNVKLTYKSLKRKSLIKTLGMFGFLLPSYFIKTNASMLNKDIEFIPYTGKNYIDENKSVEVFKKDINQNYVDWLMRCPLHKTYAFGILYKNTNIGTCILYIEKDSFKGRIVHMPYVGNDIQIWTSVLNNCLSFLEKEGCSIVDVLAHNDINKKALMKIGFVKIKKHSKPLFIKDPNSLLKNGDLHKWFLQYSEGDKAYRSF